MKFIRSLISFYCTGCGSRTEGIHSPGCPAGFTLSEDADICYTCMRPKQFCEC